MKSSPKRAAGWTEIQVSGLQSDRISGIVGGRSKWLLCGSCEVDQWLHGAIDDLSHQIQGSGVIVHPALLERVSGHL